MRNHAAAFANAAAGAAHAAAHMASVYNHHANASVLPPPIQNGYPYPPAQFVSPMPCPPLAVPHGFFAPVGQHPGVPPSPVAQASSIYPPYPVDHYAPNDYRSKRERVRFSGRRRGRSDNDSSSSGGGNSWRRPVKKKVTALIGKTGVSVLFEWASKRQITPTLTLQHDSKLFECIVYLPDKDDKGNVCFTLSIVSILPSTDLLKEWGRAKGASKAVAKQEAARKALESLMPGIVFDKETGQLQSLPTAESNPEAPTSLIDELPNLARRLVIEHPKRARETTESDDSENAFHFKEGASVCSQLLHSLVQIEPQRLLSFPVFTYEQVDAPRGTKPSFKCKGSLRTNDGSIEASCVAGTKRQSRHTVSALLLAKLFPDCQTMSEVKATAEARKEEHSRRKKQNQERQDLDGEEDQVEKTNSRVWAKPMDPPLPRLLKNEIRKVIGMKRSPSDSYDSDEVDLALTAEDTGLDDRVSSALHKLTRQRQFISVLQATLQKFNDQDEEGRSLPEEITDNDVGRTVLRFADPQDLSLIKRLFQTDENELLSTEKLVVMWSTPSCFCLLLCRAIAAYEDPPLGCAIMTFGFSDGSRILRICGLASESHLPNERFLECLRDFSIALSCRLMVGDEYFEVDGDTVLRSYISKRKQGKLFFSSQLQSVQEESAEESSDERISTGAATKPSKRSRVV